MGTSPKRSPLSLTLRHTLSRGDLGGQVAAAQNRLKALGFDQFEANGRYGTAMSQSVRKFQKSKNLKVTGDINPRTWEALFVDEED